jgi:hypothetical protein
MTSRGRYLTTCRNFPRRGWDNLSAQPKYQQASELADKSGNLLEALDRWAVADWRSYPWRTILFSFSPAPYSRWAKLPVRTLSKPHTASALSV